MSAPALFGAGPVLVLAPHPDDESLGCGALLAEIWAGGGRAHVACLTDGGASHPRSALWPRARLAALRRAELGRAVEALGGSAEDVTWLGFPDAALHRIHGPGDDLARTVAALVDRLRARMLLAPSPADPHCDHEAAADAARRVQAWRPALRLLFYPVWSRWTGGGAAPRPARTERIALRADRHRARKAAAIAAHASQSGGVVTDDPAGFAMPEGFAEMFLSGPEIYDELRP